MADQFVPGRQDSVAVRVGKNIRKVVNQALEEWRSGS
jgi:hypothetical protein